MNDIEIIKNHIKEQLNSPRDNNLKSIKNDIESGVFGGRFVNDNGKHYYVVAATSTIEDYYWVLIDKDRNIRFSSCVGNPGVVIDIVPIDMTVVYWIITHNPKEFANVIKAHIDETEADVLFTKINLEGKLY